VLHYCTMSLNPSVKLGLQIVGDILFKTYLLFRSGPEEGQQTLKGVTVDMNVNKLTDPHYMCTHHVTENVTTYSHTDITQV